MTVHELYAARQKQYQEYQIQRGIYERRLEDSLSGLMDITNKLAEASKTTDNAIIRSSVDEVTALIFEHKDELSNSEVVSEIQSKLSHISATLEGVIREALE